MELLNRSWLEQVKRLQGAGEDLKYDDEFSRLKNMNASLTPDAHQMLELSAALLPRSLDWRVCIYAIHAAAIAGLAESFVQAFSAYEYIACEKFHESFPRGPAQKSSTFLWCNQSFIVDHLILHQEKFSAQQINSIRTSLDKMTAALERESGETIKWHQLEAWLSQQSPEKNPQVSQPISEVSQTLPLASESFEHSREARPLVDKYIQSLLKEREYEKVIALSRAYRWCPLIVPKSQDNKTECEIRLPVIEEIRHKFERQDWEAVLQTSEAFFLHPHAQYFISIQFWSHKALTALGEIDAADLIVFHVKKLYKSYGKIFSLMYNCGLEFADSRTLDWVKQLFQSETLDNKKIENKEVMKWTENDPNKIEAMLSDLPVSDKMQSYVHDYLHLKFLRLKGRQNDFSLAAQGLFEKSLQDKLFQWDPSLAKALWVLIGESLLERKSKLKDSEKNQWQAHWHQLIHAVSQYDLLTATNLLKQV